MTLTTIVHLKNRMCSLRRKSKLSRKPLGGVGGLAGHAAAVQHTFGNGGCLA